MTKKEQIELIIDRIREIDDLLKRVAELLGADDFEAFGGIYDIGYQIIPEILQVDISDMIYNELEDEIIFKVMNNHMEKDEFFKRIEKYL